MKGFALFTDVSANPALKVGIGASLLLPVSFLDLPFADLKKEEIKGQISFQRFEDTSSTKLEIETVLWALGKHRTLKGRLNVFSDSQCISGLLKRKPGLLATDFTSSATNLPLKNASLYRRFYDLQEELGFEVIKMEGHSRKRDRDTAHRIFSIVDREARRALKAWLKDPAGDENAVDKKWCVYVLKCRDGSLYTGITNDLERRLKQHERGKGSKYVRSRIPFELVKTIPCLNAGEARQLEYALKKLPRKVKITALNNAALEIIQ